MKVIFTFTKSTDSYTRVTICEYNWCRRNDRIVLLSYYRVILSSLNQRP